MKPEFVPYIADSCLKFGSVVRSEKGEILIRKEGAGNGTFSAWRRASIGSPWNPVHTREQVDLGALEPQA